MKVAAYTERFHKTACFNEDSELLGLPEPDWYMTSFFIPAHCPLRALTDFTEQHVLAHIT